MGHSTEVNPGSSFSPSTIVRSARAVGLFGSSGVGCERPIGDVARARRMPVKASTAATAVLVKVGWFVMVFAS
jgi:hypothetical protein